MHKLLVTDRKGIVINTKHYGVGAIIDNVPAGIAKACLHFRQAKDLNAPSVRTHDTVGGGSPHEDFTRKLKLLLVEDHELSEEKAAELIKAHTHLVGLGAIAGDPALAQTAYALVQQGFGPFAVPGATGTLVPHPASRLIMEPGAAPTPGAGTLVTNQPTANLTGPVGVNGGTVATAVPGAVPDGGADQPSALQTANAEGEAAEVKAAADAPVTGGKRKSK